MKKGGMIVSRFTHSLCRPCWDERKPGQEPFQLKDPNTERCCECGMEHQSGIYIRADGDALACKGACDD